MKHFASPDFWITYDKLPASTRGIADKNFKLLKADVSHPSLHFKKVGKLRSVRVGIGYRALGVEIGADVLWYWIGSHADFDRMTG